MRKPKFRLPIFITVITSIVFFTSILGLGYPFSVSHFFKCLLVALFVGLFVPPFSLNPLKWLLSYYKSGSFWSSHIEKPVLSNENGENDDEVESNYQDLEKLDKLISLSRNILLVIATLGAIIITMVIQGILFPVATLGGGYPSAWPRKNSAPLPRFGEQRCSICFCLFPFA